jgi:hypothetical protein
MCKVFGQRMPNNDLLIYDFLKLEISELETCTYDWCYLGVRGRMLEVFWFYPGNRFTVVNHFGPGLDKGVEDHISEEIYH